LIEMQPNFATKAWRLLTERCAPWLSRRKGTVNEAKGSASASTAPRGLTPDRVVGDNHREASRVATVETFAGARLVEVRKLTGTDRNQR